MIINKSLLALVATSSSVAAQMGLFERSLDSHIRTICGIDFIGPTPPPSVSPTASPAPTPVPKSCGTNIGRGDCVDKAGNGYDYCVSAPLAYSPSECRAMAESLELSVGWQMGPFNLPAFSCTIYFDNADSGSFVNPLCPDGFTGLSIREGTGLPVGVNDQVIPLVACFVCD
ncbi:hypothetical protein FisN_18Hh053 [Fistulifera solaris]|uniref:Uncharacterized protein n=1 Tax=Fistulifera solaris TaxID=1519565 RepID=A0A1Z5JUY0_FISSO|nr:hypothetical protein FisN_18Hh053 [Fistulifera solaris]|eukprot:GAX17850.1 hypothetical protein FisN_18Hh053 [Fistulifera solaris]